MKCESKKPNAIKEQLLSCGVELIQKQGFHGTGIKDLVQAAGVPKGSFYYYFESKEQFTAQSIIHYITPFVDRIHALVATIGETRSAMAVLTEYFAEMASELEQNPDAGGCLLGNLLGEIDSSNQLAMAALESATENYQAALEKLIAAGQKEGDIRTDIDQKTLTGLLFDAWQGAILRNRVDKNTRALAQFIDHFLHRLLASVNQ